MILKARQEVKSFGEIPVYILEILPKFLLGQISQFYYLLSTSDCINWIKRGAGELNILYCIILMSPDMVSSGIQD